MEGGAGSSPAHPPAGRVLGDALGSWATPPLAARCGEVGSQRLESTPLGAAKALQVQGVEPRPLAAIRAYGGPADGRDATVAEALAADYRSQLKQYAQQLAGKEVEVASLRQAQAELKAQLGAAASAQQDAAGQAAHNAAAAAQLEGHLVAMEQQLQRREQEALEADKARLEAEKEAAAARAAAAAAQKSAATKCQDWEEARRYYQEQVDAKSARIKQLEEAAQKQAAEAERRAREWAQREMDLSKSQALSKDSTAALRSQLNTVQDQLEQALKKAKVAEASSAELRRQKAQMLADMRVLEDLLVEADTERREMHEKYVVLGERMEALVKEEQAARGAAQMESEAARLVVQEAVRDAESAVNERASLQKKIHELKEQLEAEQAARARLQDKVQRKLSAAEHEVGFLKSELESKIKQLKGVQADLKAVHADAEAKLDGCENQMSILKGRIAALTRELEQEKKRAGQAKEEADSLWQERLKVEQQQQALKYERRIQELEVGLAHGLTALPRSAAVTAVGCAATVPTILDYIPRSEHLRVLESRLAAKESDMSVELNSRINQTEREWQWKLEGKEQEVNSLNARLRQLEDDLHSERQRSASHSHKIADENKRLQAQCVEVQRDLDVAQKELARIKESLKDARLANAGMDDDQLAASRQTARLKHALDQANTALREAQSALDKERKRAEGSERELGQERGRVEDAYRRVARLEGELGELGAALEQKQEVVTALQAENASWSAKLMAHRDWHDQEMVAQQRQLKQEAEDKLGQLERQCSALAAELRELKLRHEEELANQAAQHAAHVAHLEKHLAAAERCAAELKELSQSLTGVRQDDLELLKGHVQDLQVKLKEAHRQRSKERWEHQAQLAALESQIRAKLAAFKTQHKMFKAQVQGDVVTACTVSQRDFEAGLAALRQQLAEKSAAAAAAQETSNSHITRLQDSLGKLVSAVSEECALPEGLAATLADAGATADAAATSRALQQAVQQHVERAAATAADAALCPLEECLLVGDGLAGSSGIEAVSPRVQGPPAQRQRQHQQPEGKPHSASPRFQSPRKAGVGSWQLALAAPRQQQAVGLPDGVEPRVGVLVSRCQQLLLDLAANEEQIRQLQQRLADYDDAFAKAKVESVAVAERAQEGAAAPLRHEVQRLHDRVAELQRRYADEVASVEGTAKQQLAEAQGQAQLALDQAASQSRQLQAEVQAERQRGDIAAVDLAHTQDELALHTQRAASKIDAQERELQLLKDRIREMERRELQSTEEMRVLKQREQLARGS